MGWNVNELQDLASVERGKFSARPRNEPKYYGGDIPFVQTGDVTGAQGKLTEYSQTLNELGLTVSRLFKKGTILVTIAANIGDVAMATFDVACPDSLVAVQVKKNVSKEWLNFILQTKKNDLERLATQNAQKNINLQVLRPLKILTPPLTEQRRIAEILGAWDEAITLTQRLIEAKQRRKQGLMQRLLTGSLRLPGFGGEWREVELESICETMSSGGTPSTQIEEYWAGTIPWITGADFGDMKIVQIRRYITKEAVANSATKVISKDDILVVTRTGVGKMTVAPFDIAISQDITGVTPKRNLVDTSYLLFALAWTIPQLAKFNQGTSINGVTRQDLKKHRILLPPLPEQRAIAAVLQTADEEIGLLGRKLSALRAQKQGLMQKLLTGAVRVSTLP